MKIAIGTDHRGYEAKNKLAAALKADGHEVIDCGTNSAEPCDYPDPAFRVASQVSRGQADRGVLICMSGIGMAIAANKVKGVRAGLCHKSSTAKLSREHNDANVLVLSSMEATEPMENIVRTWLATPFEGGRHARRVEKITEIENGLMKE
ncbi:MAG: ribose 5-phosphate isomerase B [Candidatus Omnitrophica bacterium]|nr:ribose 5-phosphate isomerase B [Candidatus Omnitrophota bacterium]